MFNLIWWLGIPIRGVVWMCGTAVVILFAIFSPLEAEQMYKEMNLTLWKFPTRY
jgi:hypothetical protein